MVIKERDPFLWLAPHLAGDEASYQEYARRLRMKLKSYFASGSCDEAEDLAAESLFRLTKRLADGDPEGRDSEDSRMSFLFGIAKNVLAEWRRRPRMREVSLRDDESERHSLKPVALIETDCLDLLRSTIDKILAQMSAADREILLETVLNADYRQSLSAMAKAKGIRPDAMRQRSARTRARFQERLMASERIDDLLRCFGLARGMA